MRIVFFGTPQTAVPALRTLLAAGHELPLVVTQPDRPIKRSSTPVPSAVKLFALSRGLTVHQAQSVKGEAFRAALESLGPDVLVVVAYGRILPGAILRVAPLGAVNVHFSLLPKYRGAAPVQWALACGEAASGVTTMLMNERMDEGDILLERELGIEPQEHAPALADRLSAAGAELLVETLSELERGQLVPRPQDHAAASYAPRLSRKDGEIDLSLAAGEVEGRVRGFDPWPGVWVRRAGSRLRIVEARALDGGALVDKPGTVLESTPLGLVVACGSGTRLLVSRLQPEGRRVMTARDALHGRQIGIGDRLEDACGRAPT